MKQVWSYLNLLLLFFFWNANLYAQNLIVDSDIPVTGISVSELQEFDSAVKHILSKTGVPGGVLAIARNEKLVYARGFGYADRSTGEPVQPVSLFRIAIVSKPITAVAILKLVEQGRLSLDQEIYPLLQLQPGDKDHIDPRIKEITVIDLLTHSGGWDRESSFDPMFSPVTISVAMGEIPPGSAETIIRYMFNRPLDFDPGTRQVYSNLGYAILGRKYIKLMQKRPESVSDSLMYYGMGLEVRLMEDLPVFMHMGDLPGTTALVASFEKTQFALILNGNAGTLENANMLLPVLLDAAEKIERWPDHDLFSKY